LWHLVFWEEKMDNGSRSRLAFWAFSFIVVFVLAGSASAQGLFGNGLPALPFLSGSSGEPSSCAPSKSTCGPLTFYAGWGADPKSTTLSFDLRSPDVGPFADDLQSITNIYPTKGLWLGLAAQSNLRGRIGLRADYWILVPANQSSDETFSLTGGLSGGKTWSTNTDWWFVDGALSCETSGLGALLAGFRYDRFATNFKNPGNFFGAAGSSSDTGDVTINCYIPFVGLQVEQGDPAGSRLMFRVIGFPWLGGDATYHDSIGNFTVLTQDRIELEKGVGEGYFLEAFGEYGRAVFGDGQISIFARWNVLHGNAKQIGITDVLGGTPLTGRYQFAFDRQSWTFGGSFGLAFATPLAGNWF
jgi:hypothetical protein